MSVAALSNGSIEPTEEEVEHCLSLMVPKIAELSEEMSDILLMYGSGHTDLEISRDLKHKFGHLDESVLNARIARWLSGFRLPHMHHTKGSREIVFQAMALALKHAPEARMTHDDQILKAAVTALDLSEADKQLLVNIAKFGSTPKKVAYIGELLGLTHVKEHKMREAIQEVFKKCPELVVSQATGTPATQPAPVTAAPAAVTEPATTLSSPEPAIIVDSSETDLNLQSACAHEDTVQHPSPEGGAKEEMFPERIKPLISKLPQAQFELLQCMVDGDTDAAIAEILQLPDVKTVGIRKKVLYRLLNLPESLDSGEEKNYREKVAIDAYLLCHPEEEKIILTLDQRIEVIRTFPDSKLQLLRFLSEGFTYDDIARELGTDRSSAEYSIVQVVFKNLGLPPSMSLSDRLAEAIAAWQAFQKPADNETDSTAFLQQRDVVQPEAAAVRPSVDLAVMKIAAKIARLVEQKKFKQMHVQMLAFVAEGLDNASIAEQEEGVDVSGIRQRVTKIFKQLEIELPEGRKNVGPKERKLVGDAYLYYLKTKDGIADIEEPEAAAIVEPHQEPVVEPPLEDAAHDSKDNSSEDEHELAVGQEEVLAAAAADAQVPDAVVAEEDASPAPPPAEERELPLAATGAAAIEVAASVAEETAIGTHLGDDASSADNDAKSAPVTVVKEPAAEPGMGEAKDSAAAAVEPEPAPLAETPPAETAPVAASVPAVIETPVLGNLIADGSTIELANPETVLDAELLDPRSPTFRKDKVELLGLGYHFDGFKPFLMENGLISLSIFVKRRS